MPAHTQIEFIAFPGYEPFATADSGHGWPHLTTPWHKFNPYAEDQNEGEDELSDAIMELVDWAIDGHPEAFGFEAPTPDDTDELNTLSINLCGEILEACEGRGKRPFADPTSNPRVFPAWIADVELTPGVTVRVARFEWKAA